MSKIRPRYLEIVNRYGSRRLGFRAKRLLGFSGPESQPHLDNNQLTCPYARPIRKYIPALGKLVEFPVPCGRCMYCRHHSQNQLIYRLYNHAKCYKSMLFVTLTYNDSHYTDDPVELRKDITKFIKRFRKELDDKTFSYYMVCERGDLYNRCHFHMILFWNGTKSKKEVSSIVYSKWCSPCRSYSVEGTLSAILESGNIFAPCPTGFIYVDYMQDSDTGVMSYVSKYVSDNQKKLVFRSWSLGLGFDILSLDYDLVQKMLHHKVIQYQPKDKLYTIAVPTYYKNKIFEVSERDVMFYDYLCSDDFVNYKKLVNDPLLMYQIYEAYLQYEKRCLDIYKARVQLKKQKKRLL